MLEAKHANGKGKRQDCDLRHNDGNLIRHNDGNLIRHNDAEPNTSQ
ncbi:MAG: hypothetical protein P8M49_07930 [Thalassotalea sp.]|nr:hypothetical protein [Thalassotalea sp.]